MSQKFPTDHRPPSALATCYNSMIPMWYPTSTESGDTIGYIGYAELALVYAEESAELLLQQHDEIDGDFFLINWTLNKIIEIQSNKLALGSKYYMDSGGTDDAELDPFNFELLTELKNYYKKGSGQFDKYIDQLGKISTMYRRK